MAAKPELRKISRELNGPVAKRRGRQKIDPNPERKGKPGADDVGRGEFLKVTVTMPPAMWTELKTVGMELRAAGERDTGVSELARVAIAEWLERQRKK